MEEYKLLTEVDGIKVESAKGKDGQDHGRFRFSTSGVSMDFARDFLYQIIMLYGLPKQQEDLIVVKNVKMKTVRRQLNIKAKKDIKEGEMITVEVDFPVSEDVYDKIEQFKIK